MDYFSWQADAFPRNKMTAFEADKTLLYDLNTKSDGLRQGR